MKGILATALLAVAFVVAPAAAQAVPTAIDPRCDEVFGVTGFITVSDPPDAPAGLAPQVSKDDMSCMIDVGPQFIYVYLDDSFAKFISVAESFAADGWSLAEMPDEGEPFPFDLATLPSRTAQDDLALLASRGPDAVAVIYSASAETSDYFAAGLFLIGNPLIGGSGSSATDIDEPSSLSELRTVGRAIPNPLQSIVLLGTASGLTVLLGVPGFLLSTVFTSRYEQWFGWAFRGRLGELRKRFASRSTGRSRWVFLGAGMVLAALISGFVDPRFGFNAMSLRVTLTLLLSFVVFNVGAWAAIAAVIKRAQPDARPSLALHPLALVVLAVAVVLSRILGFNPGVVFGLVAGVAFAITLALSRQALVILVGSAYAVVVAIVAWIAYSALNASGPPDDAALVALSEFFSGVTIQGVSTLPIALIPLANLDGGTLFAWRKWVWACAYAAGLAIFMLVLFTLPGGEAVIDGDFTRWIVIFTVFVVIALGVWFADWLVRTGRAERSKRPGAKTPVGLG